MKEVVVLAVWSERSGTWCGGLVIEGLDRRAPGSWRLLIHFDRADAQVRTEGRMIQKGWLYGYSGTPLITLG